MKDESPFITAEKAAEKRKILTYDPRGPVRQMLAAEIAKRTQEGYRAPLRGTLDECVVAHLGPKYPELLEKYNKLREAQALLDE